MKKALTVIGIVFGGLILLILFTLVKFPQSRVRDLIQGQINAALAPQGITLTMKESDLSVFLGLKYRLKGVQLTSPDWPAPMTFDEISVSPSLLGFLTGKTAAALSIKQGAGHIDADVTLRGADYKAVFKIEKLSLTQMTALTSLTGLSISGTLSGSGDIQGNNDNLGALVGSIKIDLANLGTEEARIQGFAIPKLSISSGTIQVDCGNGKANFKTANIGKALPADDIVATAKGGFTLGRRTHNSSLNIDITLALSDKVKTSLSAIDLLLGQMRRPDGSYAFNLNGGLAGGVTMNPVGGGAPGP